jgi:P pilus assembly chaperone PapD
MNTRKLFFSAFFIPLLIQLQSFARLSLTPLRIELNNFNKVQTVLLLNETNETSTYRVGFRYQVMTPTGELNNATEEEKAVMQDIEKMVIFSPKQVTLKPKQTQTMKFTFRRTPDAKLSEYAAYIVFQELDDKPIIPQLSEQPAEGEVAIKVKPLFKISIPIFVSDATSMEQKSAEIVNIKLDKEMNMLMFNLNNTGKYSTTGRLVAKFYKGKKVIGQFEQTNIVMSAPLRTRDIVMQYDETKFQDSEITSIEITYLPPLGFKEYNIAQGKLEISK